MLKGCSHFFDLKNDFPNEWYSANHPAAGATSRVMTVSKLAEKLPIFTKGKKPEKIITKNMYLFASSPRATSISSSLTNVKQAGDEVSFGAGKAAGAMSSFAAEVDAPMGELEITIGDTKTEIDKLFLVHRYVLT